MLHSHLLTLACFSLLVSTFFACLTRDTLKEGAKLAGLMTLSMIGISLVIAYIMYFFPLQ